MSDNLSVADVTATVQEAMAGACTDKLNILKPLRVVDNIYQCYHDITILPILNWWLSLSGDCNENCSYFFFLAGFRIKTRV